MTAQRERFRFRVLVLIDRSSAARSLGITFVRTAGDADSQDTGANSRWATKRPRAKWRFSLGCCSPHSRAHSAVDVRRDKYSRSIRVEEVLADRELSDDQGASASVSGGALVTLIPVPAGNGVDTLARKSSKPRLSVAILQM